MKKLLFLYFVAITVLLPTTVFAHVLKTDGSIGAVLHVDPADDPEVGKVATFFFEFKDKNNIFSLDKCDCAAVIVKGDTIVYETSLTGDVGLNSPLFQYTFTERGIYTIRAQGSPKVLGEFQSFTLSYDIRVDKGGGAASAVEQDSGNRHLFHYILFGSLLFVVLAMYFRDAYTVKKGKKKNSRRDIVVGVFAFFATVGLLFHNTQLVFADCHTVVTEVGHSCCLPVMGDTGSSLEFSSEINILTVGYGTCTYRNLVPTYAHNNKSPPSA